MTLQDAAQALADWLTTQPITMAPEIFGKETTPAHFRIGVVQTAPVPKQRVFELFPLDCEDCYEIKEIAA